SRDQCIKTKVAVPIKSISSAEALEHITTASTEFELCIDQTYRGGNLTTLSDMETDDEAANEFIYATHKQSCYEMGHTFLFGTKYSFILKAEFTPEDSSTPGERRPMQMGCYGLGLS
ncbi:10912_t:CDS:2, partial [Paraglomus occultum]